MSESLVNDRGFLGDKKAPGCLGWIFSTDHKRIGLLYFWSIVSFFCIGALLGLLIRLELFSPGADFMSAQTYNATFNLHGVIMISAI